MTSDITISALHDRAPDSRQPLLLTIRSSGSRRYAVALLTVSAMTCFGLLLPTSLDLSNFAMIYLLGVVAVATSAGHGASILAALLSVAAFDYFFVHPFFTLRVSDAQYVITFAVMLIVGFLISYLTAKIQHQYQAARIREERTATLLAMNQELSDTSEPEQIIAICLKLMHRVYQGTVTFFSQEQIHRAAVAGDTSSLNWDEISTLFRKFQRHDGPLFSIGKDSLFIPVGSGGAINGLISLTPGGHSHPVPPSQRDVIQLMIQQLSHTLERASLRKKQQEIQFEMERERIRNALLSSVSHDLRTPLAAIAGAASVLAEDGAALDFRTSRELATSILDESQRLNRIIENLVYATRIEGGSVSLARDWITIEEVIGSSLKRLEPSLRFREIRTVIAPSLPLLRGDGLLLEVVVVNILENSLKHSPEDSPLSITAEMLTGSIVVTISDQGPGIPPSIRDDVFKRFVRGPLTAAGQGIGLGLYICEGIIKAHGGEIRLATEAGLPGTSIEFSLPASDTPDLQLIKGES